MKRRHRIRRNLLLGGVVGIVLLTGLLFFPASVTRNYETREVVIPRGAGIETIAGILKSQGLVGSPHFFVLAARILGYDRHLKAGRYSVAVGSSIYRILRQLASGMAARDMVTIPEGLRADQIAALLYLQAKIDPVRFMTCVHDSAFARSLGVPANQLEGYLYPSTYPFYPLLTPEEVLRVMVDEGLRVFGEEMALPGAVSDLSLHQLVTLASIVEAEAQVPEERPRIATVFYNRLRKGMMLQSDPTVLYALGIWRGRTYYRDLNVRSPYNTYRNRGLPPGPICNPGRGALHAVLFPGPDSGELYFVARGGGTHTFSTTWEDHLRAIARVRAVAREESTITTLQPYGPGIANEVPELRAFGPAPVGKAPAVVGPMPAVGKTPASVGRTPTAVGKTPAAVGKATSTGKTPSIGKATSTRKATPTRKAPSTRRRAVRDSVR